MLILTVFGQVNIPSTPREVHSRIRGHRLIHTHIPDYKNLARDVQIVSSEESRGYQMAST